MKLSVITVCYNAKEAIEKTLLSIKTQTYTDIEIVVVDGGSNDGTQDIVRGYLRPSDKFVSEKDKGIYDAMNKGVAMASGEIVYFLNADDAFSDANVAADVMNAFTLNLSWILVYGRIVYEGLPNNIKTHTASFQIHSLTELLCNSICHQAIFSKRQLFNEYGGFDTFLKLYADRDWMLKVYFRHPADFRYIDRLIANCKYEGFTSNNQKFLTWEKLLVVFRRFPFPYALFYFVRFFLIREIRRWFSDGILTLLKRNKSETT